MNRALYVLGPAVLTALYLSGCDDHGDDLLVDYQAHALDAKAEVRRFRDGQMNAEYMTRMQAHVGEHLTEMGAIRMKMMKQCRQATDCPEGGGATGEMNGGHMKGGRYVDQEHMNEMVDREAAVEEAMDSMNSKCDRESDINACWAAYCDTIEGAFDEMAEACDDMMSDQQGRSRMMGGSGMMGDDGMQYLR